MIMRQNKGNPRVGIFVLCNFFFWFSFYAYVPTMTPYLVGLGVSYSMIGLISGAYGLSQMILRMPLGIASDRLGKRKVFINIGLIAGVVGALGMFFTRNAMVIFAMRFLTGVSASVWVVIAVLFSSYFEKGKIASRMSYLFMANSGGTLLSNLIGSAVAERFGHEYTFILSGGAALAAAVLGFYITEKTPEQQEHPSVKQLLGVVKNRNLLVMSILAVYSQMKLFTAVIAFTPEEAVRIGADSMTLGILSTLAFIPPIIVSFIGGKIFARGANIRLIIALGFSLSLVSTLVIPFAGNMTAIYASAIMAGFGHGICMNTLLCFCTITVDDSRRSAAMGFYQAVYSLGMFAGPVVIGLFVDWISLTGGFFAAAALAVIGLTLAFILLGNENKEYGSNYD